MIKKGKILGLGLLSSTFLLSGCDILNNNNNDAEKNATEKSDTGNTLSQESAYPVVEIIKAKKSSLQPEITLTGTITTKEEITIASEVTGTVQKVLKKEGDKISEGQTIMSLESSSNLLRASYSSANIALQNARKSVTLARKSAQQSIKDADLQIKNAKIALSNAKIAYDRIKNSEGFNKSSNTAATESSKKRLEIAEKNVEIAKQSLQNITEMAEQTNIRFVDSIASSTSSLLISLRGYADFVDSLVGASEFRKHDNDSFEVYLSGSSGNLIQEIQTQWRIFSHDLTDLNTHFSKISKLHYEASDKETLLPVLKNTIEKGEEMQNILRKMEQMLNKSISSSSFPESRITELKTKVLESQASLEKNIQSLKNLRQSITDFEIQTQQKISDAELAITVRESEVLAQKSQDTIAKNSESTTEVSINAELESAKNAVLNAENAVASAESQKVSMSIQGDLAIQSALAQMDASQSLVDQAALSLSKLTITSGIKGTVSKVLAFAGDTVSPGTPLVIISDYSELKLVSDVSLEESFLLKKGMKAEVSIDGIQKVFIGKISTIYPEADKVTRRVRVEILIPNTEKIPANVFATAKIKLQKQESLIYIPSETLISQNPASVMVAVRKKCSKQDQQDKGCITKYNDQQLYILEKKEIILKSQEETQFGLPVESGLRRNQYILKEKPSVIFEGDVVLLQKNTDNTDNTKSANTTPTNKTNKTDKNTEKVENSDTKKNTSTTESIRI